MPYRRPVFRPSFRPQFTSTLAFKSIQMPYSLKPHPWILNFICSMVRRQCFRIVKFSLVENSRWPPLLNMAKLIKSSFSPARLSIFGWNFIWGISRTLMLIDIKLKTICSGIGHNGPLKIYVDPKKITSTHPFKSISPKWLSIFGWNFVWSISRTLMLIGIKMKKNYNRPFKIYVYPSKIHVNPDI